jgi:putative transposase
MAITTSFIQVLRQPFEPAQYTSIAFGNRCRETGLRPSMGSVGDAYDNALCESFFATVECELIDRRRFRSQAEARMAVFTFIEG